MSSRNRVASPMIALAIAVASTVIFAPNDVGIKDARADSNTSNEKLSVVFGSSGGAIYVDKQAATPITGLSGTAEFSVGKRIDARSLAKLRMIGFRADGTNLVLALGVDLDLLSEYVGVSAAAGFAIGKESKGGNYAALGVYARAPLVSWLAIRIDASTNLVRRNDFTGTAASASLGLELQWRR